LDAEWPAATRYARHLAEHYDSLGPDYEDWSDAIRHRVAARLVELVAPRSGERVLDVACGAGAVTARICQRVRGGEIMAVDISPRFLDLTRQRLGDRVHLIRAPAEALVFADGTFDVVTMGDALVYLGDPRRGLAEARRVLRPGGRFGLSTVARGLATPAQELYFDLLRDLALRHPVSVPRPPGDRSRFGDEDVLVRLLRHAGFTDVALETTVSGGRTQDAQAWNQLMMGAGPLPHALISVLGPERRQSFEADLDRAMRVLGDNEAYRYHHAYTLAVALRPWA